MASQKKSEVGKEQESPQRKCDHPIRYQVTERNDPSNRAKITGIKCVRCGARWDYRQAA